MERIPFGARVLVGNGKCYLATTDGDMNGIACRRWGAGDAEAYEIGEEVAVETQGHILIIDGRDTRMAELRNGKIVV